MGDSDDLPGQPPRFTNAFRSGSGADQAPGKSGLAIVFGIALVVAAIILIFDPLPGDEAACAAAAMWLLRLATAGR